jgi:methyltransferase (TIGR00027 family)
MTGICDCDVKWSGSGALQGSSGAVRTYHGTWKITHSNCADALLVWTPADGDAYHTVRLSDDGTKLLEWIAHDRAQDTTRFDRHQGARSGVAERLLGADRSGYAHRDAHGDGERRRGRHRNHDRAYADGSLRLVERTMAVSHISDTARWIAVYRARESVRPDALFHDPFAARLAGERGEAIAASLKAPILFAAAMVARTVVIDELVAECLAEGCDAVVNLAAGLDTRPYRLALPKALPWIEVDLPGLIEEKALLLEGEEPRCALRRESVDLLDEDARAALFRSIPGRRVLVITEGLLGYLHDAQVTALARAIREIPGVSWWILDLQSPRIREMMTKSVGDGLGRSQLHFAPENGVAFYEALGWRAREIRSFFREGLRLGRIPLLFRPFGWIADPDPRHFGRRPWSGVARLEVSERSP